MIPATPDSFATPALAVSSIEGTRPATVAQLGERSFTVTFDVPIQARLDADTADAFGAWTWTTTPAPGFAFASLRHWVWGEHEGQSRIRYGTAGSYSGGLQIFGGGGGAYEVGYTWFMPPAGGFARTDIVAELARTTIVPPGVPGTLLNVRGFGVEYTLQPIPAPGVPLLALMWLSCAAARRRSR